jgi:hypothetical protein
MDEVIVPAVDAHVPALVASKKDQVPALEVFARNFLPYRKLVSCRPRQMQKARTSEYILDEAATIKSHLRVRTTPAIAQTDQRMSGREGMLNTIRARPRGLVGTRHQLRIDWLRNKRDRCWGRSRNPASLGFGGSCLPRHRLSNHWTGYRFLPHRLLRDSATRQKAEEGANKD